jgi:hypothetical protein
VRALHRYGLGLAVAFGAGACVAEDPTIDERCGADIECRAAAIECKPTAAWAPGTSIFEERTEETGLLAAAVQGTLLNSGDVNGDGYPDLMVRRGGVQSDDFSEGGSRSHWLLLNDKAGGFVDVTEASGIVERRQSGSELGRPATVWALGDVDNDGDLDVFTGVPTNDPARSMGETSELLLNDGAGNFALAPAENPFRREGQVDTTIGAAFVDVDRDGFLDLWNTQNGYNTSSSMVLQQSRLFRGLGGGDFDDFTADLGLETSGWNRPADLNEGRAHSRSWGAAACDLNGDGATELLSPSYGRAPNGLYQGRDDGGSVVFETRSVESGFAFDGNQDYSDNQFYLCFCSVNASNPVCDGAGPSSLNCEGSTNNWSPVSDTQAYRNGGNSAVTVCADFDNDGDIDLYQGEIRHWWAGSASDAAQILVNNGESADVTFSRPGREAMGLEVPHVTNGGWDEGLMTGAAFDFDNDGWRDLYMGASDYAGNRGLLFHNRGATDGAMKFEGVAIADFFEHNRSHGITVADFDLDGDLDVVVGHNAGSRCDASAPNNCYVTGQVRYFENVVGSSGNWVRLDLVGGPGSNRAAIGARVTVRTRASTQTFEVQGGHGLQGTQNELPVHAGLGGECVAEVTVRWPNRALTTQTFFVTGGNRYRVVQGAEPSVIE